MKIGVSWIIYLRFESNTHETHQNGCDMTLNITTFHNPLKSYARIGRVSGSDDDNEMQTLVGIVVNLCVYVFVCLCMYLSVLVRSFISFLLLFLPVCNAHQSWLWYASTAQISFSALFDDIVSKTCTHPPIHSHTQTCTYVTHIHVKVHAVM